MKKESGKRRKEDHNLSRKSKDKKERVADHSAKPPANLAARPNIPPYAPPMLPTDDDEISYKGDSSREESKNARKGKIQVYLQQKYQSTLFTGRSGYIIAILWLVGGLLYAAIVLTINTCFTKKERRENRQFPCLKRCCPWSIFLGIILTILAIVASGVVLGGSLRFQSRAQSTKNIIVETAEKASGTIYNVTDSVGAMQNISELNGGPRASSSLNKTLENLDDEADSIQRTAVKKMRLVNKGIKILKVLTIVTIVLNLIAILALLASRPLKLHQALYWLIILCWLLTFLFWIYFGLYYSIDKFVGDSCAALDQYRLNPENSTLSSILPCNQQLSSNKLLRDVGAGIYNIVDQVNANISAAKSLAPDLEYICNPFSGPPEYSYQPENCSPNTIKIGDIPQILKKYTCSDNNGGTCISASDYDRVLVYTSSIQNIVDDFPGMETLVDCQMVKDAFSEILFNQCKPLKKYVHMTWAALVTLSTIMVALVWFWILEAQHDNRKHSTDGSIKPHPSSADTAEADVTEVVAKPIEFKMEP
ncbi:Lipoate-protein ligase A [Cocos nucifera]|nr:Lipoate-protein ligase A [Cocos nucifera]